MGAGGVMGGVLVHVHVRADAVCRLGIATQTMLARLFSARRPHVYAHLHTERDTHMHMYTHRVRDGDGDGDTDTKREAQTQRERQSLAHQEKKQTSNGL